MHFDSSDGRTPCPLCGRDFAFLGRHIAMHGLDARTFRQRYPSTPLVTAAGRAARARGRKASWSLYGGQPPDARLRAFLCGALLGDGSLEATHRSARYREGGSNAVYLTWKRDLLAAYVPCSLAVRSSAPHVRSGRRYTGVWLSSATHPLLAEWRAAWYPDGVKIVPRSLVEAHLDGLALAVWLCDDGHVGPRQAFLYTMAFSTEDVCWLQALIEQRFGLWPTLLFNAQLQPYLCFGAADVPRVRQRLADQALPGMAYKYAGEVADALR